MNNVIPWRRTTHESDEIVVLDASCPDLMIQALQALQENKVVILRQEHLDKTQAQPILDFVSGSAYATSSQTLRVGSTVFLFTLYGIQIQFNMFWQYCS